MTTPISAWQQLRAGNTLSHEQPPDTPVAVVFRCSDAPLSNEAVFGQSSGSLIDVSTWGHAVDAGVMASIEYAVDTLEVPLVVVLGHDDCPAMVAALRAWEHAELPGGSMRTTVEHALISVVRRGAHADSVSSVTAAHVVETGVALMQRSPALAWRVDRRSCGIICATYAASDRNVHVHATFGAVDENSDALVELI